MIRHPYGPDELDRTDAALDEVAEQLQAYSSIESSGPPVDLAARIHAAVDAAPDPALGWWTRVVAPLSTPARGFAAAAVVVAAVIAALVVGDLADLIRNPGNVGTTPSPPANISPSPSTTSSPSPSPTPSPSPSPAVSPTQSPPTGTPAPSPSDDHGGGTDTPAPSGSDNSGPGGGGNSGPGGGGGSSGSDG